MDDGQALMNGTGDEKKVKKSKVIDHFIFIVMCNVYPNHINVLLWWL